jgi:hypothetical protein
MPAVDPSSLFPLLPGSEDATYIYVDLSDTDPEAMPGAGGTVALAGVDSAAPTLALRGGGPPLSGEWRESVGSLLFAEPAAADGAGGGYVAHTERVLHFSARPAPVTAAAAGGGSGAPAVA